MIVPEKIFSQKKIAGEFLFPIQLLVLAKYMLICAENGLTNGAQFLRKSANRRGGHLKKISEDEKLLKFKI